MLFRKWRITGLSSLLLFGCESGTNRHSYPDDPLLLDKKPVESKVESAAPPLLVQAEPTPPAMPSQAVASVADHSPTNLTGAEKQGPGSLAAKPVLGAGQGLVTATPASRSKSLPEPASEPSIRRQVPETYGHASDYSWLQGVLTKPAQGPSTLRYHDPSPEEPWGGQVSLGEDIRLTPFQNGDLILVEGEMAPDQANHPSPLYRIREIWLVHRQR
jgi:hypothetical protein